MARDQPRPQIIKVTGLPAADDSDRLPLKETGLRMNGKAKRQEQSAKDKNGDGFHPVVPMSPSTRHPTLDTRPSHLMTLSALASTLGGVVRPICLADFRFITNSNFLGCSTG